MHLFLLKTICCILIINVTFCSSCFKSVCKARCYFKHGGFDFGYCEDGICKCAPPTIYVFNGIGRDLSDEYIDNSLVNGNVIQNSIQIRPSASYTSDKNDKNKIWKDIVGKIIIKYPAIKEENLKDLKAKMFNNMSDLNNFAKNLQNSLETALNEMKNYNSSTSKECNDLLNILLKSQIASASQAIPKKEDESIIASLPRNLLNKNDITTTLSANSITGANPNGRKNNDQNVNILQTKFRTKRTLNQEDNKYIEVIIDYAEDTYENIDGNEQYVKNIKRKSSVKSQTLNNKVHKNLPALIKDDEKLDGDDDLSYESVYGSFETSEDNNVVNGIS